MKKIITPTKMAFKFIDIAANLTDPMYQGNYNGSQKHQPDLDVVLSRAWKNGLEKIIITVTSLNEADDAINMAKTNSKLFTTMGCHPTRCGEFDENPEKYYKRLCEQIEQNPDQVIAIGECGLDYDRLHFCNKETQMKYFEKQLGLPQKYNLPLFLHCRNSHDDFIEIMTRNREKFIHSSGVVHSFDGSIDDAKKIIDLDLYIGLNGCSLKTKENLNVIKEIPLNRILLETDCPWCGIRPSHAGAKMFTTHFPTVKKKEKWTPETLIDGRNEPCHIRQVVEVIAHVRDEPVQKLAEIFYNNAMELFFS